MARSRSILLDNSLGRVFSGVAKTSDAQNSNVIGGSVPRVKSIAAATKTATVIDKLNISSKITGLSLGDNGGQVTAVKVVVVKPPLGAMLVVKIRVGTTYDTSVEVDTVTLLSRALTSSSTVVFTVPAGHTIFADTKYTGVPSARAAGMTISFNHYPTPA